jgi:hypothetical protein
LGKKKKVVVVGGVETVDKALFPQVGTFLRAVDRLWARRRSLLGPGDEDAGTATRHE